MTTANLLNPQIGSGRSNAWPYLIVGLFSILVFSLYGLDLPLRRDNGIYLYSAERLLAGEPPYLSILDQKTPMTTFASALALFVAQPLTDDPLMAMRVAFIVMSILTVLLTYRLARGLVPDSAMSVLAPLMMLGFHGFVLQGAMGGEPKTVFLLFFLCALVALTEKRWFWSGLFGSLCVLTWQPAAIVPLAALLFAGLQRREDRASALGAVIVGGVVPAAVVCAYFLMTGAFMDFVRGTMVFPVYKATPEQNEVVLLIKSIWLGFPIASVFIVAGLLVYAASCVRDLFGTKAAKWSDNPYFPLGLIFLLAVLWSVVDFQGYPDFFWFLPFAALGFAMLGAAVVDFIGSTSHGRAPVLRSGVGIGIVALVAVIPFLNVWMTNRLSLHTAIWKGALQKQREAYAHVVGSAIGDCGSKCRVVVVGLPEIPALLGLKNLTRYVFFDTPGVDTFLATNYDKGFSGWLEEMSGRKPDLVIVKMTELKTFDDANRRLLLDWLNSKEFRKFSTNDDITSEKFRSDHVHTWVRQE